GQYLAFIDAYTRVHGRPPAETDMQRHFQLTPPSVHQDGPHAGAPRPYPPPARRRAQHRGAPRPPRLARSPSPPTSQIHCAEELAGASWIGGGLTGVVSAEWSSGLAGVKTLAANPPKLAAVEIALLAKALNTRLA